jgi:hypothetical protein
VGGGEGGGEVGSPDLEEFKDASLLPELCG